MAAQLRRLAGLGLAVALAVLLLAQTPTPDEPRCIPLRVFDTCAGAELEGGGFAAGPCGSIDHPCAAIDDWLDERVAKANSLFAPAGLRFDPTEHRLLPLEHARIQNAGEAWALGAGHATERVGVDVFLVDGIFRLACANGTGWAERRGTAPHPGYVMAVVTSANRTVLAHELGHYFGLTHSPDPQNPMFDPPGDGPFEPEQIEEIRAASEGLRPRTFHR